MLFDHAILRNTDGVLVKNTKHELDLRRNFCGCKAWMFRNKGVPNMLRNCKHLNIGYRILVTYCTQNPNEDSCSLERFRSWASAPGTGGRREASQLDKDELLNPRFYLTSKYRASIHSNHVDAVLLTMALSSLHSCSSLVQRLFESFSRWSTAAGLERSPGEKEPANFKVLQVSSKNMAGDLRANYLVSEKFDGVRAYSEGTLLFPYFSARNSKYQVRSVEHPTIGPNLPVLRSRSGAYVVIPKELGLYMKKVERYLAFCLLNRTLSKKKGEDRDDYHPASESPPALRVHLDGEIVCGLAEQKQETGGTADVPFCRHKLLQRSCFVACVNLSQLQLSDGAVAGRRYFTHLAETEASPEGGSGQEPTVIFPEMGREMHAGKRVLEKMSSGDLDSLWRHCQCKFIAFDFHAVPARGFAAPASTKQTIPNLDFSTRSVMLSTALQYVDRKMEHRKLASSFAEASLLRERRAGSLLAYQPFVASSSTSLFGIVKHYPLREFSCRLRSTWSSSSTPCPEKVGGGQLGNVRVGKITSIQTYMGSGTLESGPEAGAGPLCHCKPHPQTKGKSRSEPGQEPVRVPNPTSSHADKLLLAEVMAECHRLGKEGVVLRDPSFGYMPGRKKNNGAYKAKPLLCGAMEVPHHVVRSIWYLHQKSVFQGKKGVQKKVQESLHVLEAWEPVVLLGAPSPENGDKDAEDKAPRYKVLVLFKSLRDRVLDDTHESRRGALDRVALADLVKPAFCTSFCPDHNELTSVLCDRNQLLSKGTQGSEQQSTANLLKKMETLYFGNSATLEAVAAIHAICAQSSTAARAHTQSAQRDTWRVDTAMQYFDEICNAVQTKMYFHSAVFYGEGCVLVPG